ncbi:hypothetical protein RirG_043070 [Rhizophagus irregularis DAOM 197198w]|uniref:BTB domain-containing protein n=1 Tax=Rhizophagus irregularis (strain DAOM 197198w) TaxID=1432141 RepID=A0A015LRI0_RHIIW|nr:hypothetical protein RirG_043070 [Rhizophagus irregularis DAOM 197198w]
MDDYKFMLKLSKNLLEVLNDDEYHDVTIEVGIDPYIKIFRAHTIILYYRSPHLKRILSTNKKKNDETLTQVKLPNISPEIFQIILRYIYGGRISLKKCDTYNIIKILIAANELNLEELIIYIQSFLIKNKTKWMEENFDLVYQTSFENNSFLELQKYCTNLISDEPDKIFNSPKFFSIPEKLLISLIQNDYLEMNEVQIWEKVIKWGISQHPEFPSNFTDYSKDELKTLKNTLQHCISFIRFYNLSSGEFMDKVLPYRKLLPKELYEDLLKTFLNLLDPNSKSSNKSNPRKIKHNKSNQTSSQHDDEPRINKVQGSLSNDGEKTFKWKSSEPSLKTDKPTGFVLPSSFKSEKSDQSNVPGFSSNDTNKPIGFGFGSFKSEKSEHSNVPGFSSIKSDETSRFSPNDTNKPIGFGFGSFKSEKSEHSNVPGFSSIKSDETSRFSPNDTNKPIGFGFGSFKSEKSEHSNVPGFSSIKSDEPNRFSSNDTNKFTVSGSSSLFKSEKSEHSNVPGLSSDELKRFSFMYGLPSSFLKSEKSEQSNVSGFSSIKSDELKRFSSNDTDELLGYGLPSSFLKSEKSEQSNVSGFSSIKSDELKRFSSNDTDELLGYGLPSSFLKSEKSEQSNVSGFSSIKSDEPKQLSLNDTDEFPGFGLSSFKSEKSERRN